ncbi:hypothetical protein [Weissella viridescens]|uniref:hypothetical protein n=1 Tax=Weissella viridescens TaxID=1629 RepID=UPI003AF20A1C
MHWTSKKLSWCLGVSVLTGIGVLLLLCVNLKQLQQKKDDVMATLQTQKRVKQEGYSKNRVSVDQVEKTTQVALQVNRNVIQRAAQLANKSEAHLSQKDFSGLHVNTAVGTQLPGLFRGLSDVKDGQEHVTVDIGDTYTSWKNEQVFIYTNVTVKTDTGANQQVIQSVYDPTKASLVALRLSEIGRD